MKNKSINVKEASFPDFSAGDGAGNKSTEDYIDLLMNVPLNVTVEIGKAKLRMKEVLSLAQGSIIRLEKQAGAPVEVIANEQTVARGDVVVIDDNFGVRITEIISNKKFMKDAEKAVEQNSSERVNEPAQQAPVRETRTAQEPVPEPAEYEAETEEASQPEENEE